MSEAAAQPRPKPGPRPSKPRWVPAPPREFSAPEQFVEVAKKAALDNYNTMRDETHAPELKPSDLYIIDYRRILQNWVVVITSPVAKYLQWEVTYNNYRNELYINVYQKINRGRVSLGRKVPS